MPSNSFSNIKIKNGDIQVLNPVEIPENVDELSLNEQKKTRYSQDTRFRKHLAKWVMYIVPIWLALVIIIVILQGILQSFKLSDSVLITLLATTTVNVLGLAFIVLKGIFPQK